MTDLFTTLKKYFSFRRGLGSLPYIATPPRRKSGRDCLALTLRDLNVTTGVEVGVFSGESAVVWLKANPQLHLTCVDPWSGRRSKKCYQVAVDNLQPYNATIMRQASMRALSKFKDGSLDFVHIDGNHSFDFVCPDIVFWSHKLRPGGIMLVHDYLHFRNGGVIEAVNAYTRTHHIDPWFITREGLPTAFWQKP